METKSFTYMNLYTIETKQTENVLAANFKSALSYAKTITAALNGTELSTRRIDCMLEKVKVYKDDYKHSLAYSNMPFIRLAVWFVDFGDERTCYVAAKTLADVYDYIGGERKNIKTISFRSNALLEKKTENV